MIVIIGKSGCGKTTLENTLIKKGMDKIISYTTRPMRNTEINGKDYHFIDEKTFNTMLERNAFAEHTTYNGNKYGIAKEDCIDNRVVVVEKNGLLQLNEIMPNNILVIYLDACEGTRYQRMVSDRNNFEIEAMERIRRDRVAFHEVEELADIIVNTDNIDVKDFAEWLKV